MWQCEPFYYKPLDPAHPGPTTTFTAKMCPQESNFISESAVGRLKRWNLGSADGTRYRLYGELEQESKPRWATFIVVPNSAMNIEVALGTGWAVEDSQEDRDDILSSQPSHDHPLRREEIRSRLDIQDQGQSPQITAYSTHLPSDRQVPNASYQNTPDLSHTTVQIIDRRIVVSIGLENTTTSITEPRRRHIAQGA
ncbi:hypothetical protein F5Y13DRAFT_42956 [Hypoxylon sp. FL1857]|nr:hypothetical protein F5Y13DRAFT_42956 [Hypoxylon sp. FL1857]